MDNFEFTDPKQLFRDDITKQKINLASKKASKQVD